MSNGISSLHLKLHKCYPDIRFNTLQNFRVKYIFNSLIFSEN